MAFSSLKDLLKSTIPSSKEWQLRLAKEWSIALGDLSTRMRLERIQGSNIIIGVFDSHWIHELFMLSSLIIETLNNYLGHTYITHIRFVCANQKKKNGVSSIPESYEPRKKRQMSSRHEIILRSVKDVQLQEILEKVFYHCVV